MTDKGYPSSWYPQIARRETERLRQAQTADRETQRVASGIAGGLNQPGGDDDRVTVQDPPLPASNNRPVDVEPNWASGSGPLSGSGPQADAAGVDDPNAYPESWYPKRNRGASS